MLTKGYRSVIGLWKTYWFPQSLGLRLALCRVAVVAAQLFVFFPSLEKQLMFLEPFRGFIDPQILIVVISTLLPADVLPTAATFKIIYWATAASGITALIGLFTRSSAFLFALGNWVLIAHVYSYGEDHHPEALLCIFLMTLALSPSGMRLSVDALMRRRRTGSTGVEIERSTMAIWPMKLAQLLLCFAYVSTGLAKLVYGGFGWMNGYTLQQIIFTSALGREIPLGIWLAQQHTLCLLLSIGVILFEVFFFLALLWPRTLPYFMAGGILLHLGIDMAEGSSFFQYIVLYVVFIDFERWFLKWRSFRQELAPDKTQLAPQGAAEI